MSITPLKMAVCLNTSVKACLVEIEFVSEQTICEIWDQTLPCKE